MLAIAKAFSRALGGRGIETLGVRAYAKALGDQSTLPLSTGRPRLVILGTGWGGARLARDIDPKKFDITVIDVETGDLGDPGAPCAENMRA